MMKISNLATKKKKVVEHPRRQFMMLKCLCCKALTIKDKVTILISLQDKNLMENRLALESLQ